MRVILYIPVCYFGIIIIMVIIGMFSFMLYVNVIFYAARWNQKAWAKPGAV